MLRHLDATELKQSSRRAMTLVLVGESSAKKRSAAWERHSETTGRLLFPLPPLAGSRSRSMVQRATVLKRGTPCQVGISLQGTEAVTLWRHVRSCRWSKSLLFAACTFVEDYRISDEFTLSPSTWPGFRQTGNATRDPGRANAASRTSWWAAPECGAIRGR